MIFHRTSSAYEDEDEDEDDLIIHWDVIIHYRNFSIPPIRNDKQQSNDQQVEGRKESKIEAPKQKRAKQV